MEDMRAIRAKTAKYATFSATAVKSPRSEFVDCMQQYVKYSHSLQERLAKNGGSDRTKKGGDSAVLKI